MRLNKLYGILAAGYTIPTSSYYFKRHAAMELTSRACAIKSVLLSGVAAAKIPLVICYMCSAVLDSSFGTDIRELDPLNTYTEPARDPSSTTPADFTLSDCLRSREAMKDIERLVDTDIAERIVAPDWRDLAAAGCVQLLREAY